MHQKLDISEEMIRRMQRDDKEISRLKIAEKEGISPAMVTKILKNPLFYLNPSTKNTAETRSCAADIGLKCVECGQYFQAAHGKETICIPCDKHLRGHHNYKIQTIPFEE